MARKTKRKRIKKTSKTNLYQLLKSNKISLFIGISILIIFLITVSSIGARKKTSPENISQQLKSEKPLVDSKTTDKQNNEPKNEEISYQVKKNDSLARIAKNFCNDKSAWKFLAEKNNLSSPYIIHEGETLTIACQQ